MSELNPKNYWQTKATYENLARIIPFLRDAEQGDIIDYHTPEGKLFFELWTSEPYERGKMPPHLIRNIDNIEIKLGGEKPNPQLTMIARKTSKVLWTAVTHIIDAFMQKFLGTTHADYYNQHDQWIHLVDHEAGKAYRFKGNLNGKRLEYHDTVQFRNLDSPNENKFTRDFDDFLEDCLSSDFKERFSHISTLEPPCKG